MNEGLVHHDLEEALGRIVDDREFLTLDTRMGRFNLFEAVGAVRAELRHSNFLGFIFSPRRSHGFGSVALERCLRAVLESVPPSERPIRTLELVVGDLDDAVVYRERDNIDLLVELPTLNLVVVIENKVGASAGDGQLQRYKAVVEQRYPDKRRLLIFLTPNGADPECEGYVAFSYRRLAEVLEAVAQDPSFPSEARMIVGHYVEMLRRHVVPDEELRALALRLYERHREAFDFVFECRPEPQALIDVVLSCAKAVSGIVEDKHQGTISRFSPASWDQLPSLQCDASKWTKTGRGLIFEIKASANGRVHLALVLGPCDAGVRQHIYTEALKRPLFKGIVKPMGVQWATIYSRDLLTAVQAKHMEFEAQSTAVSLAWSDFQANDLGPLIEAIEEISASSAAPSHA